MLNILAHLSRRNRINSVLITCLTKLHKKNCHFDASCRTRFTLLEQPSRVPPTVVYGIDGVVSVTVDFLRKLGGFPVNDTNVHSK